MLIKIITLRPDPDTLDFYDGIVHKLSNVGFSWFYFLFVLTILVLHFSYCIFSYYLLSDEEESNLLNFRTYA